MTDQTEPARYRRAAEAQAVQWTGSNEAEMAALCSPFDFQTIDPEDRVEDPEETAAFRTHGHGGWVGLKPGDWVVKEAGRFTKSSDADFQAEWEPAGRAPAADRASVLREQIAEALWRAGGPAAAEEANVDAVLAVLPAPGQQAGLAAGLRAAADEIAGIDFHPNARARSLDIAAGLSRRLRRMADELQTAPAQHGECGAREPEPRTGTSPCVLPAGHGGTKHQDKWTNQWPISLVARSGQPDTAVEAPRTGEPS